MIHTVKDHCKQKEKISKLWEQSSKKVFDEAREATEEQFKLKRELQKLKQTKQVLPGTNTSNFDIKSNVSADQQKSILKEKELRDKIH